MQTMPPLNATKEKLLISGNIIEHDIFGINIFYGKRRKTHGGGFKPISTPEENEQKSAYRAKATARRLVNANAYKHFKIGGMPYVPIFITLTFKDDVRNVSQANAKFTDFIDRLNYYIYGSKTRQLHYLSVIEFQDKTRNGVIHYHTLFFNLRFINKIYDEIKRIWGLGNTNIKSVRQVKNIGNYMAKYMSKNVKDPRLKGQKKYFASRGLLRWKIIYQKNIVDDVLNKIPKNCRLSQGSWKNKYCVSITRTVYDIKDQRDAIDYLGKLVLE